MNKTKSHSSDKKACVVKKIVVAVILLFFITAVCLFVYSNITINNRMLNYLSEKYSVDKSQITIMEHDKAKLNFEYDFMESHISIILIISGFAKSKTENLKLNFLSFILLMIIS